MLQDMIIAMLGGLAGTTAMTGLMLAGKHMNLPAVDAHGILGYVLDADHAGGLGYLMHWLMGAVFAVGYALVFRVIPVNVIFLGIVLGIVHWLIVGWMFAFAPLVHAGMKAGTVQITGAYMLKSLGFVGFIAGAIGHVVFGVVVALVYLWLGGSLPTT